MQVTVHAAKTNLSKLIEAVPRGEEVIIARGDKPVARLVPIERKPFRYDILASEIAGPGPDFLEPMGEEELALWEGREDELS